MHTPVPICFPCDPDPVQVHRLAVSEPALSLAGHFIVEFFLVFLHPLVLLELDDLLGDLVVSVILLSDDLSRKQAMVVR